MDKDTQSQLTNEIRWAFVRLVKKYGWSYVPDHLAEELPQLDDSEKFDLWMLFLAEDQAEFPADEQLTTEMTRLMADLTEKERVAEERRQAAHREFYTGVKTRLKH